MDGSMGSYWLDDEMWARRGGAWGWEGLMIHNRKKETNMEAITHTNEQTNLDTNKIGKTAGAILGPLI